MAAKKPTSAIPAAKLALYEKLIATDPSLERKGATIPYTSANGKMFTYLSPSGDLRLRLPPEERDSFMKRYKTKVVVQHGVIMKDFVAVPPGLLLALPSSGNTFRSAERSRSSSVQRRSAHGRARRRRNGS